MKNFFRKLFFWDSPAAGAGFGWLLNIVYCYCTANWGCLSDTLFTAMRAPQELFSTLFLYLALLLVQLLLLLYSAFLTCRFFFRQDRLRYKVLFWGIIVLHIAAWVWAGEKNDVRLFMVASGVLSMVGFNALCVRKNNYYFYIAAVLLWAAAMAGLPVLLNCTNIFELAFGEIWLSPDMGLIPLAWRVPVVYTGVAAFVLSLYCLLQLWAKADGKTFHEVWGVGCTVLVFLLVLCYLTCTAFALYEEKQSEKFMLALENNFKKKISAEALAADYFRNRKVDQKFHDDLQKALEEFSGKDGDFMQIETVYKILEIPKMYQERFFGIEAEKLGKFFDKTIPTPVREYSQGNLWSITLPDLSKMRNAARIFTWQMRLASEMKDHDKAMRAWQRSGRITEYLEQEKSLIGSLVMIAVENIRLEGLEYMLAANILSDQELTLIQQYLQRSAAKMPTVNRNALYFEAVFGSDILIGMAKGTVKHNGKRMHEGVASYRFLVPGLWYLGMKNYSSLLKFYNNENLCKVEEKVKLNSYNILACMLVPALNSGGERMHMLEMRYKAFYALLEAIKIKRATGKYPEKLPLAATDHFNGHPLQYKIGSHDIFISRLAERKKPLPGELDDKRKYEVISGEIRSVQGVAVWSVGKNKLDDGGLDGFKQLEEKNVRCDDMRALLRF